MLRRSHGADEVRAETVDPSTASFLPGTSQHSLQPTSVSLPTGADIRCLAQVTGEAAPKSASFSLVSDPPIDSQWLFPPRAYEWLFPGPGKPEENLKRFREFIWSSTRLYSARA